jgi:WD40 repeat protein
MARASFFIALPCLCGLSLGASATAVAPLAVTPVTLGNILNQDSDDTLAFTSHRDTVFFDRSEGKRKTIMVSHRVNGRWSVPRSASFSGRWFDQDPVVAPDGSYLLFNSDRPIKSGGEPLVQSYFSASAGPGSNIWRVDRKGDGWAEPVWLDATINSDVFIDFASIAADGTLYFMRWDAGERSMHLWASEYRNGSYLAPQFVTLGDPKESIHDPAIAPDQSFIVFDSGKVKGGLGRMCIAFREGNHWGKPVDLGDRLNQELPWGAHLDPDGRTIYFTGKSGIQRFSVNSWLQRRRP